MYLLFSTWLAIQYYTALSGAMLSATFVWYMLPAKMFRPRVLPVGIFERLVFEVYRGDPHANAFPSSHVFTSTITAYYLSLYAPELSPLIWILGASIAVSTVFIKQHHAVDFLAGLVWAYGVIAVVSRFVV
jgi:membrane-associated phospholipid phosphatase